MILVAVLSIVLTAGLFPLVALNGTGTLEPVFRVFILFAAVLAYITLGKMQAQVLVDRDFFLIFLINLVLCLTGVLVRCLMDPCDLKAVETVLYCLLIPLVTSASALKEIHRLKRVEKKPVR